MGSTRPEIQRISPFLLHVWGGYRLLSDALKDSDYRNSAQISRIQGIDFYKKVIYWIFQNVLYFDIGKVFSFNKLRVT
jgi:hypothetical protein